MSAEVAGSNPALCRQATVRCSLSPKAPSYTQALFGFLVLRELYLLTNGRGFGKIQRSN